MPKEQTTICPKCGFPSQGPRVRPHNCAKRLAHPEQYQPLPHPAARTSKADAPSAKGHPNQSSAPGKFEVVRARWSKRQGKAESAALTVIEPETPKIAPHNQYHRNAMLGAAQAACWMVLTGAELTRIKKTLKHGQWETWVEENCEYSIRTAQKYMGVFDGVKNKALKADAKTNSDSFLALLDKPAGTLTDDEQLELLKAAHKLTGGAEITELYQDFGLLRKPHKLTGGSQHAQCPHCNAKLKSASVQECPKCGEATGFEPETDEDTPEAAALDIWTPIIKTLATEGLEEKSWAHLPDKLLRELKGVLIDLNKAVPAK